MPQSFNFLILTSCILVLIQSPIKAQQTTDAGLGVAESIDIVQKLTSVFQSWINQFDEFAEVEKRKQLIRRVDKIRKALYQLEIEKRFLLESIPSKNPDRILIRQNIDDLAESLTELKKDFGEIGADLRAVQGYEDKGKEIEEIVNTSLDLRTKGIYLILDQLDSPNYNGKILRETIETGMAITKDAQITVTEFYNQIRDHD